MRQLMGSVVFIAGVGGLGWYGATTTAQVLQQQVADGAATVAAGATHGVQTRVSGRDIFVSGPVQDQAEFDVLATGFDDVNGRRIVDMSAVEMLSVASPFEMSATRENGATTLSGAIPDEAGRAAVVQATGEDAATLELSAGAPSSEWSGVAVSGLTALAALKSGAMTLSDQSVMLTGLAASPTQRALAEAALADLPDGYSAQARIEVEDDGTPLRLSLTLRDGRIDGSGKFPAGMAAATLTDRFDQSSAVEILEATIPASDAAWPDVVVASVEALGVLQNGALDIQDNSITLTGAASPDAKARAEALIAGLPAGFTASADITIFDDGAPFALTIQSDGATATAQGKFPAGFTLSGPDGITITNDGRNGFLPAETGDFAANVQAGIAALGMLENGTLEVSETDISLTGVATTPDVADAIGAAVLSGAPQANFTQDLTFLDDGSPAAWTFEYGATQGGTLSGKLPAGLTPDMIVQATGLGAIAGAPVTAFADDDAGNALEVLSIATQYLPETENLAFSTTGGTGVLDIILSPGVNADLVAADLAERLPANIEFSAATLDTLPQTGDIRTNSATLLREEFQFGNWLPILTFAPTVTICAERASAVLGGSGVNFLSASAQLDAKSNRAINTLAVIARRCIDEGGLRLEVAGHTDNTGSVLSNEVLSENRAVAVRNALLMRGVDATAITAVGYGQAVPIADNDTPEGRAANRRTEINWFE